MTIKECLKCGHEWISRAEWPRACPKCKTYSYWIRSKRTKGAVGRRSEKPSEPTSHSEPTEGKDEMDS